MSSAKRKEPKTTAAKAAAKASATQPVAPQPQAMAANAQQKAVAALTSKMIHKMTGQKPIAEQKGAQPHIPSGSTIIDTLISGAAITEEAQLVCPGYPRRRIVEIYGPESSGKTTVALAAVASVQRNGGVAMFLDLEHALAHRYARKIGVRFDESFMVYAPDTMEEAFKMMTVGMSAGVDLIVVDSVAAMIPATELEKGLDEAAKIGIVAMKMSINLPKFALWLSKLPQGPDKKPLPGALGSTILLLNQERAKINTSGGKGGKGGGGGDNDPNTTGGKALKFYTYLRLRFTKVRSEYIKRKINGKEVSKPYGNVTAVKIVKTKVVGNQGDSGLIFIRYGIGLDDIYSLIEVGAANRVVGREGAFYTYEGERWQGKDKFRACLVSNATMLDKLRKEVTQSLMMHSAPVQDEEITQEDQIEEMVGSFDEDDTPDPPEEQSEVEADDADEGLDEEGDGEEGDGEES